MKNIFERIKSLWINRGCYVILDPNDSSVTLSRRLYMTMGFVDGTENNAFVLNTAVDGTKTYGFMLNPPVDLVGKGTQLNTVQVNQKLHCVGFATLAPTVAKILYDYGLPAFSKCRFSAIRHNTENGIIYFTFERNEQRTKRLFT